MESKMDNFSFTSYKDRITQWGTPNHQLILPNIPTIIDSDMPEELFKILMIRIQLEEAYYKLEHIEEEKEYVIWRENTIPMQQWSNKTAKAAKSRATELLTREISMLEDELYKINPPILPVVNQ